MAESRKHKQIAQKLANLKNTEYRPDKGVDIRTKEQAIEVEIDPSKFGHAKRQLAGTTKTPYVAVPHELVKQAKEAMENTRFGVMTATGKIAKRGRRKK